MNHHTNHHVFFYNTLTKEKELFVPLNAPDVSLYVCGITPYDYSHIGHGRTYINFDLLYRLLEYLGYNVTYIRNITDIDDKLLNKATQDPEQKDYLSIGTFFYNDFQEQLKHLNCIPPTHEPRATQSIATIIQLIETLINKGYAYQIDSDVYFDIASDSDYGKLSRKKIEDLLCGARIDVDSRKKNPGDFALWKGNNEQQFWQSPWGYGRPGWHIECSAMIARTIKTSLDIHAGGQDLIFPHHENEIAQSESATEYPLARFWLHSEFININKEKMSKSLNNTILLKDITQNCKPASFRFYILQHHYKTAIDFSYEGVVSAEAALMRLYNALKPYLDQSVSPAETKRHPLAYQIIAALADDLNTPVALGLIFENFKKIQEDPNYALALVDILKNILGINFEDLEVKVTPEMEELIAQREAARMAKDFKKADALRDQLKELGYVVQDKKM